MWHRPLLVGEGPVKSPLMPEGVEHRSRSFSSSPRTAVKSPLMPEGVEHRVEYGLRDRPRR